MSSVRVSELFVTTFNHYYEHSNNIIIDWPIKKYDPGTKKYNIICLI